MNKLIQSVNLYVSGQRSATYKSTEFSFPFLLPQPYIIVDCYKRNSGGQCPS